MEKGINDGLIDLGLINLPLHFEASIVFINIDLFNNINAAATLIMTPFPRIYQQIIDSIYLFK